ncbi:MAG: ATP-binding protein [Hydrogenoanaerobacterium sp.]
MEMTSLLNFDILEDSIKTPKGNYYFFKVKAPNFSTLSTDEQEHHYRSFESLMRSACDISFNIYIADRTVNLNANRKYIEEISEEYDYIKNDLLACLVEVEGDGGNTERGYYFSIRTKSQSDVSRFSGYLQVAGFHCELADKDELTSIMRSFLLREFVDRGIYIYDEPKSDEKTSELSPLVRQLLPTRMDFDINCIIQSGIFRKTMVVRNLPQDITGDNNGFLKKLVQRKNTTVSIRISDMRVTEVQRMVNKQFNNANAGLFRKKQTEVLAAEKDANTLTAFYRDCLEHAGDGGGVKCANIYIELYGKTQKELETNAGSFENTCRAWGVTLEEFTLRQKEGFFGVLPIGWDTRSTQLANNIPSNTMGRLYPFSASYLNDANGMILGKTIDNGIISVDFSVRDMIRTNSNIVIIGDPGQGKSYLMKKIINLSYISGTVIFIIDSENEYGDEVKALGGTNINCVHGNFVINPLQIRFFRSGDEDEQEEKDFDETVAAFQKGASPLFQHLSWLSDFFRVLIPSISPTQLAALKIIVQDVYKQKGITEESNFLTIQSEDFPIMTDVYEYINAVLGDRATYSFYKMIDDSVLKDLLLLLYDVYKGSLSPMFNKATNVVNSSLINLNIQELLAGSDDNLQAVLFNYLTYFWSRIMLKEKQIMLAIDEVYLLMNRENPTIVKYLNTFSRRSRKYEALLVTATQRIMDCLDDKIVHLTAAVFDIPTYKFLFYPGSIDLQVMQKKLKLTDGEVDAIRFSNKRHCLFKSGNDNYHMVVGTLPYEKTLFGTGGGR